MGIPDTQNDKPDSALKLTEVGIKNLKILMTIKRNGTIYKFTPVCNLYIDLPGNLRGAHLSRLVEAITGVLTKEAPSYHDSVEKMALTVLNKVFDKHTFTRAKITMDFDFGVVTKTPVSNKQTIEVYRVIVTCLKAKDYNEPFYQVSVIAKGNTACPHGLATSDGKMTHIQRAQGKLTVAGTIANIPTFESMIDIVESSFSSRTYSILKTEDEKVVIRNMYDNPNFCEDVTRNILSEAQAILVEKKGLKLDISAETISEESIHKHDVISRGEIKNGALPDTVRW
ncbi:MAG: GTP cyclohydrolase I FolE2 [Candidatus Hodarchaeales archaeon]